MKIKKMISLFILMGCVVIPGVQIYAKEDDKNAKYLAADTQNMGEFQNLFPNMKDTDTVFQVNGGGFLYSVDGDAQAIAKDFKNLNKDVTLKKFSVADAKKHIASELNDYITKEKKGR